MYIYNSIPHIINTLNLGKELLQVLFEKRKSAFPAPPSSPLSSALAVVCLPSWRREHWPASATAK